MKKWVLAMITVFLVTQIFCVRQSFAQSTDSKIESFTNEVMNKIKNADFENLFNDYYIPEKSENYTDKDIQNDKENIPIALKELLQNKLGLPENFTIVDNISERFVNVGISAGPAQALSGPFVSCDYKVKFAKFGDGYITVAVHISGEKILIKFIQADLPESNPASLKIAQDFAKFMTNIFEEQQKKDSLSASK